ncbi:uncharacterized protein LOC123315524 [Coccinella septempunctata]|uniref:uncharacterized protein LOC123315496 n=1 Tax=Coccinella septempunctata TaxID=41139 RepID=UPI001D06E39A|nr:uncharacterized protein LOC123315496 [Coccinella septempunctata]XP_044757186.1 uncharacterized protein LOC123315524 [Coccinella septempunctata]
MNTLQITFIMFGIVGCALSIPTQPPTTVKPKEQSVDPFVPHATYLSANSYVDNVPYGVAYNPQPPQTYSNGYFTGLMPSARSSLEVIVWLFTRVGAVVLGSTALFVLGGLFNALVCSMTSFCSYDFQAISSLDQESVRALITPEKISTAAALVQDAIGKYNRLQREIRN